MVEQSDSIYFFGQYFGSNATGSLYAAIYTRYLDVACAEVLQRWNQLAYSYRPAWLKPQPEVARWRTGNGTLEMFESQWLRGAIAAFEIGD